MMRRPYIWIWHCAPYFGKDHVRPHPCLTPYQFEKKARPPPQVAWILPWGGSAQAPYDHEMAGVVRQVPDKHVLEGPEVRLKNVVRLGPHFNPLLQHHPLPPFPTPMATSWEEVLRKILQPYRLNHCYNLFVPALPSLPLQVNVQVPCNNHLCPPWYITHCGLYIPNCRPISRHQVTSDNVPAPLPLCQLVHYDVCKKLVYHLNCEVGGSW